ncbi:hypothetical protein [Marinifilum fragile]|uniref:hypothetical protein n=1 Tax=Marinifilum fragile TaxID=570161 RepID=UPI0006D124E5|nr:hypothetical protein [Marinifilum fragile]
MKKLMFILIVIAVSCAPQPEKISESEVMKTIEGFFEAFEKENNTTELLDDYITKDFIIYEAQREMNKEEFLEFVASFPIIESDWKMSDLKISTDINSAHISLFNTGNFIMQFDTTKVHHKYEWFESAYMVKEDGKLKIKFYFSDNVSMETDTIK